MKNGLETDEFGDKRWYCNGELHREDVPVVEYIDDDVEYWLNGEEYNSLQELKMQNALR